MAALHASSPPSPFRIPPVVPGDEERFYLTPPILAAVRREASAADAGDWATYAQDKLDRELHACSLLLSDEQVAMLHRYAEVLGTRPHDLLVMLLAPEAARRERHRQQVIAFLRRHRMQRHFGCFAMAVICVMLLIISMLLALHLVAALGTALAYP